LSLISEFFSEELKVFIEMPVNNTYHDIASHAVFMEQQQMYAIAAQCWTDASLCARRHDNTKWAKQRAEFCLKEAQRNTSSDAES
jgi:hypothetical protein